MAPAHSSTVLKPTRSVLALAVALVLAFAALAHDGIVVRAVDIGAGLGDDSNDDGFVPPSLQIYQVSRSAKAPGPSHTGTKYPAGSNPSLR